MYNSVSALQGKAYEGIVELRELGLRGMITLRGDLASAEVKNAVTGVSGVDMPGQREIRLVEETGAAWMSPDEMLVLVPYDEVGTRLETMQAALASVHHLAVDVSDARALFEVRGAKVREVIAKLCPVDMAEDAFGPGQIRRTRMAQIPAAFWMVDDETVQVMCFRSVAEYAFNLLQDAAQPGGEVGAF